MRPNLPSSGPLLHGLAQQQLTEPADAIAHGGDRGDDPADKRAPDRANSCMRVYIYTYKHMYTHVPMNIHICIYTDT